MTTHPTAHANTLHVAVIGVTDATESSVSAGYLSPNLPNQEAREKTSADLPETLICFQSSTTKEVLYTSLTADFPSNQQLGYLLILSAGFFCYFSWVLLTRRDLARGQSLKRLLTGLFVGTSVCVFCGSNVFLIARSVTTLVIINFKPTLTATMEILEFSFTDFPLAKFPRGTPKRTQAGLYPARQAIPIC